MADVDAVRARILVDNKAGEGLRAEHGLSVWIEAGGRKWLFDTGGGAALADNVHRLDVPLDAVDTLILSHGHYDHTGGIPLVLDCAPAAHVYCHPSARNPRFAIRNGSARAIGMPDAARAAIEGVPPGRMHWVTEPQEIAPGIGVTGPVPRHTEFEDTGGPFFLDPEGRSPDPLEDDLALWVRMEAGLVVVVGCSHAGLVNTLDYVRRLNGARKVRAVLGGFHLLDASEARVERTTGALAELAPDLIVPCHCTGERAVERLRQAFGERVRPGSAGTTLAFGSSSARRQVAHET